MRIALAALVTLTAARALAQPSCNANPVGPDQLTLEVAEAGSDFDLGWTGAYHDLQVPGGARFELCLSACDDSGDSLCTVQGYAGGQSATGRSFAPPIAVVIGGVAACIVTTFREPFATGTADVATGAIDVSANVSADVFLTTPSAVCPTCSGAVAGAAGTCQGGATPGAPCTTGEVISVQGATGNPYRVSRDCRPAGATPLSIAFPLDVTTGPATRNGLCNGQARADDCGAGTCEAGGCAAGGSGGVAQSCCSTNPGRRCFTDPLVRDGAEDAPLPAWPDPTYPKQGAARLASAFCAPAVPGLPGLAVNGSVGLAGPAAFVLPVAATWSLDPSPVTTTTTPVSTTTSTVAGVTTTTGIGATTTSTTLPGCTDAAQCNDDDACTADDCPAGTCVNAPLTGAAGVDCALGGLVTAPLCESGLDAKLSSALMQAVDKARAAIARLDGATAKKARRLAKAADRALGRFLKKLAKATRKQPLGPGCDEAIRRSIDALRQQIAAL